MMLYEQVTEFLPSKKKQNSDLFIGVKKLQGE